MVMTSILALFTTTLTGTSFAEDSAVVPSSPVVVTYELQENVPADTLILRLRDHNLTLNNFRLAESQESAVFSVNPLDGSVSIKRADQLDFESQRKFRFIVLADKDLVEQDPFLETFSAGLQEDGLTAEAFKSLATGTVTFDVTIQLRDVPEPPELHDTNLEVQVLNDSEIEFGTLAAINHQSAGKLHYFIVSGDEDELFRINSDTGTLSFCGGAARNLEMTSTHELVILVEDSVGLSATANVVVSVVNKAPQSIPTSSKVTAQASEKISKRDAAGVESGTSTASLLPFSLPFGLRVRPNQEVVSGLPSAVVQNPKSDATLAPNATDPVLVAGPDPDSASTHAAATIDMGEVGNWLAPTAVGTGTTQKSATASNATNSESFHAVTNSLAPQKMLSALVAMIVFLISCVVAAVGFSRAVTARKAVLAEIPGRGDSNSLVLRNQETEEERDLLQRFPLWREVG